MNILRNNLLHLPDDCLAYASLQVKCPIGILPTMLKHKCTTTISTSPAATAAAAVAAVAEVTISIGA